MELESPYCEAARVLSQHGCTKVGILTGGNQVEYPLWVLLNGGGLGPCRIEDVGIENESAKANSTSASPFGPDALISTVNSRPPQMALGSDIYHVVWSSELVSVYLRDLQTSTAQRPGLSDGRQQGKE
jgi:hypothetical protein